MNSGAFDQAAFISKDGRTLYFSSNRPDGVGGTDIWVSHRPNVNKPWGTPTNVTPVNSDLGDFAPHLTADGRTLFFGSNRAGGAGGFDLYMTQRRSKRDDLAWHTPVNLDTLNTVANEEHPFYFEDDATGTVLLYFTSNRAGSDDIYVSTLQDDGTFGLPTLVEELNSDFNDRQVTIRRDGLELFFASDRSGTLDLWVSTRGHTSEPWSEPVNLGPVVNDSTFVDARPSLSFKATELYFQSNRPGGLGNQDLYVITRSRVRDHDDEADDEAEANDEVEVDEEEAD